VTLRAIRLWPDPILREISQPVKDVSDPAIQSLIEDMAETCRRVNGAGLAAVQVGVLLRLAVVDLNRNDDGLKEDPTVLVNPKIVHAEGEALMEEGCLSIPGESEPVVRPARLRLRALDREGRPFEMEGEEFLARAVCHELDHMDGRLYIDLLSPLKRSRLLRRVKKRIREGAWEGIYPLP